MESMKGFELNQHIFVFSDVQKVNDFNTKAHYLLSFKMYTVVKVLFLRNPNNLKALLANKLYFHNSVCLL